MLLDLIDQLWNYCVARGGWKIVSVLAMSVKPREVTMARDATDEAQENRGYASSVRAVGTGHPIDLAFAGRQAKGVDRGAPASAVLLDVCRAVAYLRSVDDHGKEKIEAEAEELYAIAHHTVYFKDRTYSPQELAQGPSLESAAALASAGARANGESHGDVESCACE